MTGLAISCGITGSNLPPDLDTLPPGPPAAGEITALVVPRATPLFSGQSIVQMPGYADMVRAENFVAPQGRIARVDISATGDAPDVTSALAEGQSAGFSVRVETDSVPPVVQVFNTEKPPVQYTFSASTNSNKFELDVNPLLPADTVITFAITEMTDDSAYLNGNYSASAGTILSASSGPVYIDKKDLFYSGSNADLGAGDSVTVRSGLIVYETTDLNVTYQLQKNSGAGFSDTGPAQHSPDFTLLSADENSAIRGKVIANDGINPSLTYFTEAVNVSAGGHVEFVGSTIGTYTGVSTTTPSTTIDLSAFAAGDQLIIAVGPTQIHSTLTIDGIAAEKVADNGSSTRHRMSLFKYVLPVDGSASAAFVATSNNTSNVEQFLVIGCRGGGDFVSIDHSTSSSGETLSAITMPTQAGNIVGALSLGANIEFSSNTWTGVTVDAEADDLPGSDGYAIAHSEDGSTDGVTVSKTGNGADRHALYVFTYE